MPKSILPIQISESAKIRAAVEIDPALGFSQTASKLEAAFPGLSMEPTEQFDEIPGFVGEAGGIIFELFGIVPAEARVTNLKREWFQLLIRTEGAAIFVDPEVRDLSSEICDYLSAKLSVRCWVPS